MKRLVLAISILMLLTLTSWAQTEAQPRSTPVLLAQARGEQRFAARENRRERHRRHRHRRHHYRHHYRG
jgi:hypothetical protein